MWLHFECSAPYRTNLPLFNFWHSGTLALMAECQSAGMSEIKNGRLGLHDKVSSFEELGFKGLTIMCIFLSHHKVTMSRVVPGSTLHLKQASGKTAVFLACIALDLTSQFEWYIFRVGQTKMGRHLSDLHNALGITLHTPAVWPKLFLDMLRQPQRPF